MADVDRGGDQFQSHHSFIPIDNAMHPPAIRTSLYPATLRGSLHDVPMAAVGSVSLDSFTVCVLSLDDYSLVVTVDVVDQPCPYELF